MDGRNSSVNKFIALMKDAKPFMFDVDRGDGERLKIMYSALSDKYF